MLQQRRREGEGAAVGENGRTTEEQVVYLRFGAHVLTLRCEGDRLGVDQRRSSVRQGEGWESIGERVRSTGGGVAERVERGLFIRSVAPVAEWLRWDGRGGHWGGWRWCSPQRERGSRRQDRRSSEGYAHRTVPAGWCHHAPSMAQIAPLVPGQEEAKGEAGAGVGSGGAERVRMGRTFLGHVSLCLEEVTGDSEGEAGSACFGQVSRRLGRLLKRLPKSRSWSDSLRILRRSSSNGSLLNTSGMAMAKGCVQAAKPGNVIIGCRFFRMDEKEGPALWKNGKMMSRQVELGWPQRSAVGQNICVLCALVCLSVFELSP